MWFPLFVQILLRVFVKAGLSRRRLSPAWLSISRESYWFPPVCCKDALPFGIPMFRLAADDRGTANDASTDDVYRTTNASGAEYPVLRSDKYTQDLSQSQTFSAVSGGYRLNSTPQLFSRPIKKTFPLPEIPETKQGKKSTKRRIEGSKDGFNWFINEWQWISDCMNIRTLP